MNLFGNLFGGFLFSRVGAFMRYIYGTISRDLGFNKKHKYTLHEYIHGSERPDDNHWDKGDSHEFVNRIVGTITVVALIWLIIHYVIPLF